MRASQAVGQLHITGEPERAAAAAMRRAWPRFAASGFSMRIGTPCCAAASATSAVSALLVQQSRASGRCAHSPSSAVSPTSKPNSVRARSRRGALGSTAATGRTWPVP